MLMNQNMGLGVTSVNTFLSYTRVTRVRRFVFTNTICLSLNCNFFYLFIDLMLLFHFTFFYIFYRNHSEHVVNVLFFSDMLH